MTLCSPSYLVLEVKIIVSHADNQSSYSLLVVHEFSSLRVLRRFGINFLYSKYTICYNIDSHIFDYVLCVCISCKYSAEGQSATILYNNLFVCNFIRLSIRIGTWHSIRMELCCAYLFLMHRLINRMGLVLVENEDLRAVKPVSAYMHSYSQMA